jgi:hypothetical protein
MVKSKWIELLEWCVFATILAFMVGVFIRGIDQETDSPRAPLTHLDE